MGKHLPIIIVLLICQGVIIPISLVLGFLLLFLGVPFFIGGAIMWFLLNFGLYNHFLEKKNKEEAEKRHDELVRKQLEEMERNKD